MLKQKTMNKYKKAWSELLETICLFTKIDDDSFITGSCQGVILQELLDKSDNKCLEKIHTANPKRRCHVSYTKYDFELKKMIAHDGVGYFHEWSVSYEEFETGAGNYAIGIIELDDGTVVTSCPENIKFLDRQDKTY